MTVCSITEFYQGKPCKRGHAGLRYKSTSACVECMKDWAAKRKKVPPQEAAA